jgi:ribose transport system permease protein
MRKTELWMSASETYARWRYRLIPDHVVGEVLAKSWIDNAIPALILGIVLVYFGIEMPEFLSAAGLSDISRVFGEYLFIAVGMTFVMMAGGIDLSVGSNFALCNLAALALINYLELPLVVGMPAVMLVGGLVGLINGILIGYLRLRAFLTTLVMLIIVRAIVDMLLLEYAMTIGRGFNASAAWEFLLASSSQPSLPSSLTSSLPASASAGMCWLWAGRAGRPTMPGSR